MPARRLTPLLAAVWLGAVPAAAQDSGFAIELSPPADEWTGFRHTLSVFGETVEPAAGYVRGCPGFVTEERAGVQIEVAAPLPVLTLTLADAAIEGLVIGTPDGLYRCVRRGADGLIAARLDGVEPGRYRAWPAGAEASRIATRLILADRPVSALELRGFDVAALGAPRAGTHAFTGESPRQVLARGAPLFAQQAMALLDPSGYCAGYGRFDAADAVLTLAEPARNLAIFARSDVDLTLAVRAPDGRWLCNDDSFGLDPATIFETAPAGDYLVFVGAFGEGREGRFDLFASLGAPSWDGSVFAAGAPRRGVFAFDRDQAGLGAQLLTRGAVMPSDPMTNLPIGTFCPGYTLTEAPDAAVVLAEGEAAISLFAASQIDLVLAVRAPDGRWFCNDDSDGLNPAVTIDAAPAGEYLVYVGGYNQGMAGNYALYAAMGVPDWTQATDQGSAAALDPTAAPAVGRVGFGPGTRIDPRVIFDIQPSQFEARGMGEGCEGFITPSTPDVVIAAEPALPQLMVYMVAEADGVLVVVGPDGTVHCNDDFEGLNPAVMIPNPAAGDWAVFAGTYGGTGGMATLGVTIASPRWVMDREH